MVKEFSDIFRPTINAVSWQLARWMSGVSELKSEGSGGRAGTRRRSAEMQEGQIKRAGAFVTVCSLVEVAVMMKHMHHLKLHHTHTHTPGSSVCVCVCVLLVTCVHRQEVCQVEAAEGAQGRR